MKRGAVLNHVVWYGVSTFILIVMLFPIYWMFMVSLKLPEEIFKSPPIWFPKTPQFNNFLALFLDGDVWSLWNSLVIAGVSTIIAMVLGTMCAYAIVRFKTGGDNLAIWILSQRMLPPIAIVFPIFLAYAFFGLSDSYPGLILLYTAFALPYVVWMMRGYLEEVPLELEEAALVDGHSHWSVLWRVTVPMARNGLIATAIFAFVFGLLVGADNAGHLGGALGGALLGLLIPVSWRRRSMLDQFFNVLALLSTAAILYSLTMLVLSWLSAGSR